jgi:hypothetical protein
LSQLGCKIPLAHEAKQIGGPVAYAGMTTPWPFPDFGLPRALCARERDNPPYPTCSTSDSFRRSLRNRPPKMKANDPPIEELVAAAIHRSRGSTASERLLADLGDQAFLNLWSYPNLFYDKKRGARATAKNYATCWWCAVTT